MLIGKQELCELIPHSGDMCLLERVISWNDREIRCSAISHTDPVNPLRRNNRLAPVHLLEYGAQAMAVHGGLLAARSGGGVAPGYLAALRDVTLPQQSIDCISSPLLVHAKVIASVQDSFIYNFSVAANGVKLAQARATVMAPKEETG